MDLLWTRRIVVSTINPQQIRDDSTNLQQIYVMEFGPHPASTFVCRMPLYTVEFRAMVTTEH